MDVEVAKFIVYRPYLVTDVLRGASPLCTVHRPEELGDQDTGVVLL